MKKETEAQRFGKRVEFLSQRAEGVSLGEMEGEKRRGVGVHKQLRSSGVNDITM